VYCIWFIRMKMASRILALDMTTQNETVTRNFIPECILHSILMFLSCFLRCIVILAYHIAICFNSNVWRVNEWVRDFCLTPRQHFIQLSYGGKSYRFIFSSFLQLHCPSFFEQLFLTIPLLSLNLSDFWWDDGEICFTNLPNWILIVLAHRNSSPQVDISHNSDAVYWLSKNQFFAVSLMLLVAVKQRISMA
jgi:hypothetical protein